MGLFFLDRRMSIGSLIEILIHVILLTKMIRISHQKGGIMMKNIVVAGGGVLGSQIAFQAAYCGFHVTIWLRSEGSITPVSYTHLFLLRLQPRSRKMRFSIRVLTQ